MEAMTRPVPCHLSQQISLIWHPHPISLVAGRTHMVCAVKPGSTVKDIALASGIDPHQPIVISLDDRLLRPEEWDTVCPESHQILNVHATVQGGGGGGGGSNVLQIVILVAVVVAAVYTGGLAAEAYAAAYGAGAAATAVGAGVTAVIGIAGAMIVNAVFAAQVPGVDTANTSGQYSQPSATYSLSGGSNRMRPYESMPVVMGSHRYFPDLAAKPFSEYHGEDQYLYQIFHLGLSTADFSDWKIGTTSINSYQDYTWYGIDQNGRINAFPGNVDSTPGTEIVNSSGWITRSTASNTYRIGLDIEGTLYYANNAGGLDATSVQIRVQYKPSSSGTWLDPTYISSTGPGFVAGHYENYQHWVKSGYWGWGSGWTSDEYGNPYWGEYWGWIDTSHYETRSRFVAGSGGTVIISGNSQAPRRSTLFIDVPVGTYDVRVIRDTGDSTDARLQNKTSWSSMRSYQQDSGAYVGQNRIGLIIRASEQLNGIIQQLSVTAEAYATYWNGSSWSWGKTSNPAHWFTDFAVGRRNTAGKLIYGLGLPKSQIDVDALHSWATFCANEGLTFNAVLDDNKTAADVLTAIARCGFASPSWGSGKLGVVWDSRNATAVGAYGMSNIIKGSFEVSYITEQLAEEIIVRFMNPAKDWTQDEVRVLVPGVTTPTRTSTIDLFGCTSVSMAGKFANYLAAQQKYRKRRISWDADFEGLTCQRGDVIILSHDLTQWGYSGRIVSVTGNTIQLDRSVPRSGNTEYLMLKRPDGTLVTYTAAAASGETDQITLSAAPNMQNGRKDMDHMWFFSPLATPGKRVKILSVQPISDSRVRIIATDEDPEFYAAWDGSWQEAPSKTMLLNNKPFVSSISVTEALYRGADSGIISKISIQWLARGSYERANLRYRIAGGPWESAQAYGTSYQFNTDKIGTIEIEILPIYGALVGEKATHSTYLFGITASPPNVDGLTDFYRSGRTVLSWRAVADPRTIDYEIRKGISWEKGQVLGRVPTTEFVTDGDGTYWVAAHTGNVYSADPSGISIDGGTLVANVIAAFDEEATGWSGTLSGGARLVGTDIVLAGAGTFSAIPLLSAETSVFYYGGVASTGGYEIPSGHEIDIVAAQACSVSVSYRLRADNPFALFSRIPVVSAVASISGNYAGYADCKIQMAVAPDSGVYGEWRDFVPGSYVGRKFKFRAVLSSLDPSVTAILDQMIFSVDVPDRIENGTSINCPSSGLTVTYNPAFQATPNVQITILDAQQGDEVYLPDANQSATGFTVQIRNAGSGVSRKINWLSQGY
jgi:Putative phage tail protein